MKIWSVFDIFNYVGTTNGTITPWSQASEGIGNKLNMPAEGSGYPNDFKRVSKASVHSETSRMLEGEALWLHTTATHSVSLECLRVMTAEVHANACIPTGLSSKAHDSILSLCA